MTSIPELPVWSDTIRQINTGEKISGNLYGVANRALIQLSNRTNYLKNSGNLHHIEYTADGSGGNLEIDLQSYDNILLTVDAHNLAVNFTFINAKYGAKIDFIIYNNNESQSPTFPSYFNFGKAAETMPYGYSTIILHCHVLNFNTIDWKVSIFYVDTRIVTYALYATGRNYDGEYGDGTTSIQPHFHLIDDTIKYKSFSPMSDAFYIKEDGTLWNWGARYEISIPVQIGSDDNWETVSSCSHNLAIKEDRTLWSWGSNNFGQLGLNFESYKVSSPTQVGFETDWKIASVIYFFTSVAIKNDGTLWAWGHNGSGRLGDGTTEDRSVPVQIAPGKTFTYISDSHSQFYHVLDQENRLWGTGKNSHGELGDGTTVDKSSLVQIGTNQDWKMIVSNPYDVLAIKTDGTLWHWGWNNWHVAGYDTYSGESFPVQVGAETDWESVNIGTYCAYAIKTNGTLWVWGCKDVYNLDQGWGGPSIIYYPTQVGKTNVPPMGWDQVYAWEATIFALQLREN